MEYGRFVALLTQEPSAIERLARERVECFNCGKATEVQDLAFYEAESGLNLGCPHCGVLWMEFGTQSR